jgi:hypothetical protein
MDVRFGVLTTMTVRIATFLQVMLVGRTLQPSVRKQNIPSKPWCSRITSTKSPSFCMTNFSASLTNMTGLLSQSQDGSCYVSRRTRTPSPLWLKKHTDLCAHNFAHSLDLWLQPRLASFTCTWSWRICGITPATYIYHITLCNIP